MLTQERMQELITALRGHSVARENITEEYRKNLLLAERQEKVLSTEAGEFRLYIFTAKNRKPHCPVHINVHGGGFVRKHELRDEIWSCRVADAIEGITVDLDYSLAPEHPYPTALNEAYATAKWVFSMAEEWDADTDRISMGGYSAGANLTAAVCMRARESGEFRLCFQVLGYGCLDLSVPAAEKPGAAGNLIPAERSDMFDEAYSGGDRRLLQEPFASPCKAPAELLQGLPDALVIAAGKDMFRYEDLDYAFRLVSGGSKVILQQYRASDHGFIIHCSGEWEDAQKLILDTLKTAGL